MGVLADGHDSPAPLRQEDAPRRTPGDLTPPTHAMKRAILTAAVLALAACQSTSVQTYSSPEEATRAIIAAAEIGDGKDASRIFDTFARSSVQRDRVLAELVDAGVSRQEDGRYRAAADVLGFVCQRYPDAVNAKELLVFALLLERGTSESAEPGLIDELERAVANVRAASPAPAFWVDLAATHVAVEAGDLAIARENFAAFMGAWSGEPAALTIQVEDLDRRLGAE